ncbi:MAG: DUF2240 family protein [Candidatus Diapherotrites archaeon]
MADSTASKQSLVERIVSSTRKSENEVIELIEKKKEKFSGLLSDEGAAFIVAKELGLQVGVPSFSPEKLRVSELETGMSNFELVVRVLNVFCPREFTKDSRKGFMCNLLVADDSGSIRLTLWHDFVKKLEELNIKRNSALRLKGCYVTEFNNFKQLNLGSNGSIELVQEKELKEGLPEEKHLHLKVSELKEGLNEVDVIARITKIFPAKSFDSNERQGNLTAFELGDDSGIVRAVAWNELAKELGKFAAGDIVRIEGAYTKAGLNGTELHLGWKARITKEKDLSAAIPALNELLGIQVKSKALNELGEGDRDIEVKGKIIALNKGNLMFRVCPKCNAKLERIDEKDFTEGLFCSRCGMEVSEPDFTPVVSFELDDGTSSIRVLAFGATAEKFLELKKEELKKKLEQTTAEGVIEELAQKIEGREAVVLGNVKLNPKNNELELTARNIILT